MPTPSPVPTQAPDALLQRHQRSVEQYSQQILRAIADFSVGVEQLDRLMDQLPDAAEAVRENPLSRDAVEQLRSFTQQLEAAACRANGIGEQVAKLADFGRRQLTLFESRLNEVRRCEADECPMDQSTCAGDDVTEGL